MPGHLENVLWLVDYDQHGNRLGLPAGLGNLPLHLDRDGWHSVLGAWHGTTDNPVTASEAADSEADPDNNNVIPIAPMSPPRNIRPLSNVFCHYHMCTGHRLVVTFQTRLYFGAN